MTTKKSSKTSAKQKKSASGFIAPDENIEKTEDNCSFCGKLRPTAVLMRSGINDTLLCSYCAYTAIAVFENKNTEILMYIYNQMRGVK